MCPESLHRLHKDPESNENRGSVEYERVAYSLASSKSDQTYQAQHTLN